MKKLNELMIEIIDLTTVIETRYPELYKYLDETPLFLSNEPKKEIQTTDLINYLHTLKEQLRDHIDAHKLRVS